jgi:hypothetical protein
MSILPRDLHGLFLFLGDYYCFDVDVPHVDADEHGHADTVDPPRDYHKINQDSASAQNHVSENVVPPTSIPEGLRFHQKDEDSGDGQGQEEDWGGGSVKSHELPRAAKPMQLVLSSASRDYSRVARTNVISPTHSELPQWHSIACVEQNSTGSRVYLNNWKCLCICIACSVLPQWHKQHVYRPFHEQRKLHQNAHSGTCESVFLRDHHPPISQLAGYRANPQHQQAQGAGQLRCTSNRLI